MFVDVIIGYENNRGNTLVGEKSRYVENICLLWCLDSSHHFYFLKMIFDIEYKT